MVVIGIDPGSTTGLAPYDCRERRFYKFETHDFWSAYYKVFWWQKWTEEVDRKMLVKIEDPNENKPVFPRGVNSEAARMKIAQNVGSNKREASLLIEGLRRKDIVVDTVRPMDKKWDAEELLKYTGYSARSNQHQRDAAKIAYGTPEIPEEQWEYFAKRLTEVA